MKSKPNSPFLKCLAVAALVSGVLSLSGCGNAPTANSSANSVSSAEGGETTSSLTPDTPSTENPDTPSSEVPSSEESSNEEPSPKIKSFQLDSGNGKINGSSYGESKEGEVTYSDALDADGHAFSLTYHCCMGHAGDFAQVKKGAGYIFKRQKVHMRAVNHRFIGSFPLSAPISTPCILANRAS